MSVKKQVLATCPDCGERVDILAGHDCPVDPIFDGFCPMCGRAYESYTSHIRECEPAASGT